jgi:hypothetical protein
MSAKNITIEDIVHFQSTPRSYVRHEPFTATIYHTSLTIAEKAVIQSALVNAAHEIRRRRGVEDVMPFTLVYPKEDGE